MANEGTEKVERVLGIYTKLMNGFGKEINMWIRSQGDLITDVKYR